MQILENYFISSFRPLRLRKIIFLHLNIGEILLIQLHFTFANPTSENDTTLQSYNFEILEILEIFKFC